MKAGPRLVKEAEKWGDKVGLKDYVMSIRESVKNNEFKVGFNSTHRE